MRDSNVTKVTVVAGQEAIVTNVDEGTHKISVANAKKVNELIAAIQVDSKKGSFKVYTDNKKEKEVNGTEAVTKDMVVEATAEDGKTKQVYTIEVAAAPKSNSTKVTVVAGQEAIVTNVDEGTHKISVANAKKVNELIAAIQVDSKKGSFKVYTDNKKEKEVNGTEVVTKDMVVEATAQDGTTQVYTIEVE